LNQRMSVEERLDAVDECGAPVVSIAGGEPLLHGDIDQIAKGIIARKKFLYLCTNALLMEKKLDLFAPNPFFVWSVHLDGDREMHDQSVCLDGVYDRAVAVIRRAKACGFRVNINCTLFDGAVPERVAAFFDTVMAMGIDGITVSPGYAYERAPDQAHFLNRRKTKELFRGILRCGRGRKWSFSESGTLPRLPRRPLHALGQPDAELFRLAAPLLPPRRKLRQELQGAHGGNGLERLRHRQL
jgi:hopanoid biosynthesis associated radical SAM protein HpnH